LEQSFTAHMPLLTATSAFGLQRRHVISPQWCYLHRLCTISSFIGRPFLKRSALCYQTIVCPVCDIGVLWPKSWMYQVELDMEVGLSLTVSDGDPAPPCLLWPNGWMDQDATWYGGRSQPRQHCTQLHN